VFTVVPRNGQKIRGEKEEKKGFVHKNHGKKDEEIAWRYFLFKGGGGEHSEPSGDQSVERRQNKANSRFEKG